MYARINGEIMQVYFFWKRDKYRERNTRYAHYLYNFFILANKANIDNNREFYSSLWYVVMFGSVKNVLLRAEIKT